MSYDNLGPRPSLLARFFLAFIYYIEKVDRFFSQRFWTKYKNSLKSLNFFAPIQPENQKTRKKVERLFYNLVKIFFNIFFNVFLHCSSPQENTVTLGRSMPSSPLLVSHISWCFTNSSPSCSQHLLCNQNKMSQEFQGNNAITMWD